MRVFKFGGASIKNAEAIKNVGQILQNYKDQPLAIVVSAMGKTTNQLEAVVNAYYQQTGEANTLLDSIKSAHYQVLSALFEQGDEIFDLVNDTFVEIDWVIEDAPEESYDYLYDQIVSIGEFASTRILTAYLCKIGLPTTWLDIRDAIRTDNTYREANVEIGR